MPLVKYSDLELAVQFVSSGELVDAKAYISRESGEIFWQSDDNDSNKEIPSDVDDSDLYAVIPSQRELDLGKHLVLRFISRELPDQYEEVESIFRRKGAYSRYKDHLSQVGLLDAWHQYEQSALQTAIIEWAESERITVKKDINEFAT